MGKYGFQLLFEPFIYKNDDFTKTGSGQTEGKTPKKEHLRHQHDGA
jgi:hypothetical protein